MGVSTDDRLAILDLIARCYYAYDHGDAESFADAWTADGVFELGSRTARGRAELMAMVTRSVERGGTGRHWTANAMIDGDGDRATLRFYVMVVRIDGQQRQIALSGVEHHQLQRIDGSWKFVQSRFTSDSG